MADPSAGLSLTFTPLATAKQQARPKTASSQRPMVCGCLCDTCPRGLQVFMGLEPAQSHLRRDPSPPLGIDPSSRLAALQVAYLGPGDSCCFQRGSGWAKVTRTHVRAWSVFPRVRCSRVTWSSRGICAGDCLPGSPGRWQGSGEGRGSRTGAWLGAQCRQRTCFCPQGNGLPVTPYPDCSSAEAVYRVWACDFWDRAGHGLPGDWCGPRLVPRVRWVSVRCKVGVRAEAAPGRHRAAQWEVGTRLQSNLEAFPKEKEGPGFPATQMTQAKTPGPPAVARTQRPAETQLVHLPVRLSFPAPRSFVMQSGEKLEKCGRAAGGSQELGCREEERCRLGWAAEV